MSNQITPNPSVPSQVVAEVTFPRWINNLGIIPTSYKDSMSYYECLAWLCKFLEETVIPTVNENGEATQELQNLYVELNSFVTHYFDNLDVQEEINNKLDAMVDSGEMSEIINQEIFGQINHRLDVLESEKILIIGDSYAYGIIPGGTTTPFPSLIASKFRIDSGDVYNYSAPGAGFTNKSETYNKNFADLVADSISGISSANKALITKVLIVGGYNDRGTATNTIQTAESSVITSLKTAYPNATIYVGMIANDSNISNDGRVARYNLFINSLQAYKKCNDYGAVYLTGIENVMKEYNLFASDGIHPNQNGQNKLANAIFQLLKFGSYSFKDGLFTVSISNPTFSGTLTSYLIASNDCVHFRFDAGTITLTNTVTNNPSGGNTFSLGTTDLRYIRNVFNRSLGSTPIRLFDSSNNYYDFTAQVLYDDSGYLKLYILSDLSDTTIAFSKIQFIENNFDVQLYNC